MYLKLKMKKGQLSAEIMFLAAIMMVIFISLLAINYIKRTELISERESFENEMSCTQISNIIDQAMIIGPGIKINSTIPRVSRMINNTLMVSAPIHNPNTVKVAYYSCHIDEAFLNPALTGFYHEEFIRGDGKCGYYPDSKLDELISKSYSFTTIYLEDPHLNSAYLSKFENIVKNGTALIVSEHAINSAGTAFGKEFAFRGRNLGNEKAIITAKNDPVYEFETGDEIIFNEYPYFNTEEIVVARFEDLKPAITYWRYGDGIISHFPDFNADMENKDFTRIITTHIININELIFDSENFYFCSNTANITSTEFSYDYQLWNVNGTIDLINY